MTTFKKDDWVRISDGPDKGRTGVVETAQESDQVGEVYSVRLDIPVRDGVSERLYSNSLGADQLELV